MKPAVIALATASILPGCAQWFSYTPDSDNAARPQTSRVTPAFFREESLFMRGFQAMKSGDYLAAEPLLYRHLQNQPNDPYALLAMGAVMEQTDREADAMSYYRRAARYGSASPAGETLAVEDTPGQRPRTVSELAAYNITRLESR